jgi:hypothetical protein
MRIPMRLILNTVLIVAVATVIPLIADAALREVRDAMFYLSFAFYITVPIGIGLAVAYVLAKCYVVRGERHILAFGMALLVWGLSGVASVVFIFFASWLGPGYVVGDFGFLLSSLLHFFGLLPTRTASTARETPDLRLRDWHWLIRGPPS